MIDINETDLGRHVNAPGRDELVKQVRAKIDELGVTLRLLPVHFSYRARGG